MDYRSARARYAVSCLGLLAMLAAPALTMAALQSPASTASILRQRESPFPATVFNPDRSRGEPQRDAASTSPKPLADADAALATLVALWMAGVAILAVRL